MIKIIYELKFFLIFWNIFWARINNSFFQKIFFSIGLVLIWIIGSPNFLNLIG